MCICVVSDEKLLRKFDVFESLILKIDEDLAQ